MLTQQQREWTLGRLQPAGQDLKATTGIRLPAAARAGPATLELRDGAGAEAASVDLVLS